MKWETAWNESVAFAVRLDPAKIVATGTPKMGHPLVKALLADERVVKTHMRMVDNLDNLHPAAVEELLAKYEGTRLGRQELEGEFLEDVEGTLWTRELLDRTRRSESPIELLRIVVAVDPSGSSKESAHNAGVVVCALGERDRHGYVLADSTTHGSPEKWAAAAVGAYHQWEADCIVAETNFGGELVRVALNAVDRSVPVKMVSASLGKQRRAEPVALLYEQDRVHHVRAFPELEDEMTSWTPDSSISPDRMDALVWGITELMLARGEVVSDPAYGGITEPVVRRGDLVLRG